MNETAYLLTAILRCHNNVMQYNYNAVYREKYAEKTLQSIRFIVKTI